ncbi:MAG TPA: penicillin-binding protein 2 [Solirubrobacteraceae bacterium]|jgi:peptidoglycan glycosyltransferase|nr:penicillin-binding protein 2 [Solirubrobacteraceae bacterium]
MNRPIVRLYGLVALLFALLVAFTSRWTIFEASSLREDPLNKRALLEQERIERGPILAADGTVLARSVRGAEGIYQRVYPTGELFAQPIGFDYVVPDLGSAGVERYRNKGLNGQNGTNLQSVLDQLQGKEPRGEKVITTLDPSAQRVARAALGEHEGAVVALEPRSGAVEVMASSPSYNPNALRSPAARLAQQRQMNASPPTRSELNRATQFGYAPGSTFKIVTATAAIDTGEYTPESVVNGRNGIVVSGKLLQNDNGESFGPITLSYALAHSVNTVYAQVAEHVGKRTLGRYMERFGFDRKPQLDYPADEMSASGEHDGESIVPPTSPSVDVGRMGIGQDKLAVTPLQMAEVAAAVGNHGTLMVPHLTQRIVDSEGRTVQTVSPRVQSAVMKPSTASAVRTMMEAVVKEGTGTAAAIPGVQVAGKTGTAETQFGNSINNVWFIAFAPAADPTVAVAVTLKAVPGEGATFAAPVARAVIENLLRHAP